MAKAGLSIGSVCRWFPIVLGIGAVVLALAADLLGVDPDLRWGPFRVALLVFGIAWLAGLAVLRAIDRMDRLVSQRLRPSLDVTHKRRTLAEVVEVRQAIQDDGKPWRVIRWLRGRAAGRRRNILGLLGFIIAVELVYVWYASASLMTRWPETTTVFASLGESFLQGRVDLLESPAPALELLENPYDPGQRSGIAVVLDAVYFRGRYYRYWGPAPAVVAAFWKLATGEPLGDAQITFIGVSLGFLSSVLIVLHLRRLCFPGLPGWLLGIGLGVVAVAHPVLWNLSYPDNLVAPIAMGQAGLLGGVFTALPAMLGRGASRPRLALAGTLWGVALASRLALLPAVVVCIAGVAAGLRSARGHLGTRAGAARTILAAAAPVAMTLMCLGAYNYVRFGNIMETGLQYQLTSNWDYTRLSADREIFNVRYILPNAYYYGLAPVSLHPDFPFLGAVQDEIPGVRAFLGRFGVPDGHSIDVVSGLFLVVPFSILGLIVPTRLACEGGSGDRSDSSPTSVVERWRLLRLLMTLLLAAGATSLVILAYGHVATRFVQDFSPLLMIAAVVGAWEFNRRERDRPVRGRLVNALILVLAVATVIISMLLAVGGPASRIDDYNPSLWRLLSSVDDS